MHIAPNEYFLEKNTTKYPNKSVGTSTVLVRVNCLIIRQIITHVYNCLKETHLVHSRSLHVVNIINFKEEIITGKLFQITKNILTGSETAKHINKNGIGILPGILRLLCI